MKQCSECGKTYPNTDSFCSADGSKLRSLPETGGTRRKAALTLAFSVAVLGFMFVNGFPYILKWAASNFQVSLVGISYENDSISGGLGRQTREILEDFVDVITDGKRKPSEIKQQVLILLLEVKNNTMIPVKITSLEFEFLINTRQVGRGNLLGDKSILVHAFESKTFKCPLTLYPMPFLKSAGKILVSGLLRYGIRGRIVAEFLFWKIKCPFDVKGIKVPL
ncbi:MAG: LEA type 2 family protein [Nitrospina sp.]|jgi:hypothetical protein|nr:LEA type 2 family protein [Nitrospina sp.]